MQHQEKKYLIDSFSQIMKILRDKGAEKHTEITTFHYYGQHPGNDVVKLVRFADKNEIHILAESQGKFSLKERIPVKNTAEGLKWLKDKGYQVVNPVKMVNTDYKYKDGFVGLYIIDGFLHSVILDYPEGQHEKIAVEFGLDKYEVIQVPYNKLLEQMGRLRSRKLT